MHSITIKSTVVRVAINDDEARVIEFDPGDVLFAERFYQVYNEWSSKQVEYQARANELEAKSRDDVEGEIPASAEDGIKFMKDVCEFWRQKIDYLFGPETSQKAFGDALSMDMIGQFFAGMAPFVQSARAEKIAEYTAPVKKKSGKKVMD